MPQIPVWPRGQFSRVWIHTRGSSTSSIHRSRKYRCDGSRWQCALAMVSEATFQVTCVHLHRNVSWLPSGLRTAAIPLKASVRSDRVVRMPLQVWPDSDRIQDFDEGRPSELRGLNQHDAVTCPVWRSSGADNNRRPWQMRFSTEVLYHWANQSKIDLEFVTTVVRWQEIGASSYSSRDVCLLSLEEVRDLAWRIGSWFCNL